VIEVIQGDALRVVPGLPAGAYNLIATDPPYSSGGLFRSDRAVVPLKKYLPDEYHAKYQNMGFSGDNLDQRSWTRWTMEWMGDLLRVAAPGAVLMVFIDWRNLPAMTDAIQGGGWVWRGILPWSKTAAARPHKGYFRNQCEFVLHATAGPLPGEQTHAAEVPCLEGFFVYPITNKDKHHPTGKPTALMRDLLAVCPKGGRVLDCFAGSGTTGVAAAQLGLEATLIEKDDHHIETIRRRLVDEAPLVTTGEGAV